jgi:hypothetical protein
MVVRALREMLFPHWKTNGWRERSRCDHMLISAPKLVKALAYHVPF